MSDFCTNTKTSLRQEMLKRRSLLTQAEVADKSQIIVRKILSLKEYISCSKLCLYSPIKNEVNIISLAESALAAGKAVYLPKVEGNIMNFCIYNHSVNLCKGAFGILEPESSSILYDDFKSTLVIMPGAVFSEKRERIGYGGGYYDRFLSEHAECTAVAVAYDFQVTSELPSEKHDIKPQKIVTENRIIE